MKLKHNLYRQIVAIVLIMFAIIHTNVAVIIPSILTPVYEKTIYSYLANPLDLVKDDINSSDITSGIAYIYIRDTNTYPSNNLREIIDVDIEQILEKIKDNNGKFTLGKKTYYYNTKKESNGKIIAITDDRYIRNMHSDLLSTLFPIIMTTLLLILSVVAWWSRSLAEKIATLKEKVDNLDNDNYTCKKTFKVDDELKVLSDAIDDMKKTLQLQEEYKNQMYQNISHDFKTPLTVMKSYIEAIEDGVEDEKKGLKIIKEEINKLELKVHSLLYLNKLSFIKDMDGYKSDIIDLKPLLTKTVEKFKVTRPDIKWKLDILDKNAKYKGSTDMWEAIIDNILSNFIRYADKEIKVTVLFHKITFYNDGPNIDDTILNDVFTPYKKGIKGKFGLGLSIVKQTLNLLGYTIKVKNERKGISFIIK
ncbi:MAG: HAMP domain-containing histidine kinase [Bacilli bacterium]|nr:HAMP domain-containing histidine kinase [Bacilli bacterium]